MTARPDLQTVRGPNASPILSEFESLLVKSPNTFVRPVSASKNEKGHLTVGGCDTVELAERFGTPLWILDEETIRQGAKCYLEGLRDYPNSLVLYAGKAFMCLAMCRLAEELGLGLDVVSAGELFTARIAEFPASLIYMHGNNKSAQEIETGLAYGAAVIIDSLPELALVSAIAGKLGRRCKVLLRLTPGVEPDTHDHIKTGHHGSKFGLPLEQVHEAIASARASKFLDLVGIHAHIGSQAAQLEPYVQNINILADVAGDLARRDGLVLKEFNVGGGLAIAYTDQDRPVPIFEWARTVASATKDAFGKRNLELPRLLVEPGRSIVGPAGVTIYRVGLRKQLPDGPTYVAVDGGMADNPRPITYQALYTACLANRPDELSQSDPVSIVGKYCESGDIIIKEAPLPAQPGDLLAVFGTGAYNYSMASNYNRSPRPACVLVRDGAAEVIVERESFEDLIRMDRIPKRLEVGNG